MQKVVDISRDSGIMATIKATQQHRKQMNTPAQIHEQLKTDPAYAWSVELQNPINMQMVLRAYGYSHTFVDGLDQIEYAIQTGA